MSRPKGALNKRTRAALHEAEHGKLEKAASSTLSYLSRIVTDRKRDDQVRMQAANILLPYLRPKLSAVEQTTISDKDQESHEDIMAKLNALVNSQPELLRHLLDAQREAVPEPVLQ